MSDQGIGSSPEARALLDWHMANLECVYASPCLCGISRPSRRYANACSTLDSLSLGQWDQDDPYEMSGDHVLIPGGNLRVVASLAQGLPIFYNTRVEKVLHDGDGVTLHCTEVGSSGDETGGPGRTRVFSADAALVTLPLGVLKRGSVLFEPPLPPRKRLAIESLGFGTLNKLVMLFREPFWNTAQDTFGRVAESRNSRGDFFLFYQYAPLSGPGGGAVLIGLVAGSAAVSFEAEHPQAAMQRCVEVLRSIFSQQGVTVPDPVDYRCTAWASDPYSLGSYSHVPVGATGEDYDELQRPIGRKLFFAGEATTRTHPATMHGALFSGLREAARIAQLWEPERGPQPQRPPARGLGPGAPARDLAPLQKHLAAAFAAPDWECGIFACALHPTEEERPDSPALMRIDVGGAALPTKTMLPVYLCIRRSDAQALRDTPGSDAERLLLLSHMKGGELVGSGRVLQAETEAFFAQYHQCLNE